MVGDHIVDEEFHLAAARRDRVAKKLAKIASGKGTATPEKIALLQSEFARLDSEASAYLLDGEIDDAESA